MRKLICWAAILAATTGPVAVGDELAVPLAPAAPDFALPAADGAFPVGVRSFAWVDTQRAETATATEGDSRELTVQIWYPAALDGNAGKALYTPELEAMLAASAGLLARDRNFVRAHERLADTATNSVPGARLAESDRPWPVILFSPGGNVSRHWQTALAERMASRGFLLVSMAHPHSTMDVAPLSGFSMSIDWGLDQEDAAAARAADDHLANVLAADAAFILEKLHELAAAEGEGPFAGRIELERVGIAGHSRGGTTVGRACATNSAFKACAVIDNIGPDRESELGVPPPFLTLRSPWPEERIAALHGFLSLTGSVAYDVELADSNHFTCTDLPFFMSDLRVDGVEPASGVDACADILASFFDAYLVRGLAADGAWKPAIAAAQVTVTKF